MGKLSRTKMTEELLRVVFNLYILDHGGIENQAYLTILWVSGRTDELLKVLTKKLKEAQE